MPQRHHQRLRLARAILLPHRWHADAQDPRLVRRGRHLDPRRRLEPHVVVQQPAAAHRRQRHVVVARTQRGARERRGPREGLAFRGVAPHRRVRPARRQLLLGDEGVDLHAQKRRDRRVRVEQFDHETTGFRAVGLTWCRGFHTEDDGVAVRAASGPPVRRARLHVRPRGGRVRSAYHEQRIVAQLAIVLRRQGEFGIRPVRPADLPQDARRGSVQRKQPGGRGREDGGKNGRARAGHARIIR